VEEILEKGQGPHGAGEPMMMMVMMVTINV
jgi:hypothetical protein